MKETAAARRYAKAFAAKFPAKKALEDMGRDLSSFAELFDEQRALRMTLLNPSVPPSVKEGILMAVMARMNFAEESKAALRHVLLKGRMEIARFIAEEFERISFEALGKVRAQVTSAVELDGQEKAELQKSLSAFAGKEAVMEIKVDPALIGGVVARMGSVVYDGSVANQLKSLKVRLN